MRWWAGGALAVVGLLLIVVTLADQPMPRSTPWWWRYGRPAALSVVGVGLMLCGAHLAGAAHR